MPSLSFPGDSQICKSNWVWEGQDLCHSKLCLARLAPAKQAPGFHFSLNQGLQTVGPPLLRGIFVWSALSSDSTDRTDNSSFYKLQMAYQHFSFSWWSLSLTWWSGHLFPCQLATGLLSFICINSLALLGFWIFNPCFKWTCASGPETPSAFPKMVVNSCPKTHMPFHVRLLLVLAVGNTKSNTSSSKAEGGLFPLLYTGIFMQSATTEAHFKVTAILLKDGSVRAQTSSP